MFNEPRNWKWMVPSMMMVLCIVAYGATESWGEWSYAWLGLGGICGLAGLMNLILYAYAPAAQVQAEVRDAMNATPEVRMFEAAKGMHPEAVKYLLTQRRTIWRVRYVAQADLVDWVLDEAPSVHVGFVEYVLDHSNSEGLMPKNILSEGAYTFDPDKMTLDRDQYQDFVMLLQQKFMATQAFGNQSARWIAPWGPETVRRRMGLEESVISDQCSVVSEQGEEGEG